MLIHAYTKKVDEKLVNPTSVQWPKAGLGLEVEAEIQILKVIYYVGMYVALSSFHEEFKSRFVVGTAYGNRPNFFSRAHLETRPKSFK